MTMPVRYEFDSVFALEDSRTPEPPKVDLLTAETQAKAAFDEGYQQGHAAAIEDQSARALQTLETLMNALPAIELSAAGHVRELEAEVCRIGTDIARKLARTLIARHPIAEVETMLAEAIGDLVTVPHLVVRVHESLSEDLSAKADNLARASGFEGRLIIMGEPDIPPGDGRIEWADGGITRDTQAIEDRINQAVHDFMEQHSPDQTGDTVE